MDRETNCLLHLLGAYIHGETPRMDSRTDWNRLIRLSHIHNVTGILGYLNMTFALCPQEEISAHLRQICLSTIARFSQRFSMADLLCRELEQRGIDHLLMKGYILRGYHPVPELRTFGDIDIVIRPRDREACHRLMLELGYQVKTDWEPVYSYTKPGEFYEIHTDMMEVDVSDKADHRAYFRNLWEHARCQEGHCYQLTPEYHFLYLLTHIAKHVTGSGAGIRMYLDIALFLKHFGDSPDWEYVQRELDALQLSEFANVTLTLVQQLWNVPSPIALKAVDPAVMDMFLEYTMAGGIFGQEARNSGTVSVKDQSQGDRISRTATLVQRLFPSAKSIESRYTYLQDKPWLLPAAWVHRLFKTGADWELHREEARNILSADPEEVRKIRTLYRQIGL